jgi:hypothetical protein
MAIFTSTDQTITDSGTLTLAHGLGAVPKLVQHYLVCQTANNGWAIGDVVTPMECSQGNPTNGGIGVAVKVDATNLTVYYGSKSGDQAMLVAGSVPGGPFFITESQWKMRFVAST